MRLHSTDSSACQPRVYTTQLRELSRGPFDANKNVPSAEANRLGFEPVPRIMCDLILQIRLQASRGFTPRSYGSDPVARSTRIKNVPPAAAKGHINVNVSRSHFAFVRYVVSSSRCDENGGLVATPPHYYIMRCCYFPTPIMILNILSRTLPPHIRLT